MLKAMNELDEVWTQMINAALERAAASGRGDVADYLSLKAANDAVRAAGVKWLFDSMLAIASEANRRQNVLITIENENPHNFAAGNSNLVGSLLRLRQNVRCLTIEAGWTRTANDGFMRGGALARARISHFGINRANEELLLARTDDLTNWFAVDKDNQQKLFDSRNLQQHLAIFLGEL